MVDASETKKVLFTLDSQNQAIHYMTLADPRMRQMTFCHCPFVGHQSVRVLYRYTMIQRLRIAFGYAVAVKCL